MAEIEIINVSKSYTPGLFKKKVQAVTDLSLKINRGEVFGLIGPNGAGKSTTIRLMLGLSRPDRGSIRFRGKSLAESNIRQEIGYLPENPYLYDHLTLDELLVFCGRVVRLERADVARRSDSLTEKVGLAHARRRPLRTFSKGMLQRAGICFALLHDPDLVILDEPMSGLDPLGRAMVIDIIRELKGRGKTIFFCSHILSDVERLCDRIGMLVGGRLAGTFEKDSFRQDDRYPLHLLVRPVDSERKRTLSEIAGEILEGPESWVVSLAPERLAEFGRVADLEGIEVLASQSERVSLEKLFISTVQEQTP